MKQAIYSAIAAAFLAGCGAQAQSTPSGSFSGDTDSFNNNVCTAIGDNNTVICNAPYRTPFTDALGAALIQHMPDKAKPVILNTIGGETDQEIGTQVQKYLVSHGYRISTHNMIGMTAPPPDHPFTLQSNGNQYQLTVAPSAH
jgi:hypothetical protein